MQVDQEELPLPPLPPEQSVQPSSAPPSFQSSFPNYGAAIWQRQREEASELAMSSNTFSNDTALSQTTLPQHDDADNIQHPLNASRVTEDLASPAVAASTTEQITEDSSLSIEAQAQFGRLRALHIAKQFERDHQQHLQIEQHQRQEQLPLQPLLPIHQQAIITQQQQQRSEFSRKRMVCLERLEKRKQLAMQKNLNYLVRVQEQRWKANLRQIEAIVQTKEDEAKAQANQLNPTILNKYSKAFTASKYNNINTNNLHNSQAGLGTMQRNKVDAAIRKQQPHVDVVNTVAIYVSNLPTDGSATEDLLKALFASLGYSLRKIHIYRSKETGKPKGDALVIYDLLPDQSRNTLTEVVCSQMNQAELPCGTAIKVEPSDPLYKLRKKKSDRPHEMAADGTQGQSLEQPLGSDPQTSSTRGKDDDPEELDDFFASLADDEIPSTESNDKALPVEVMNPGAHQDEDLDDFFSSIS